jgi:YVTN family beta-propeller protein
VLAFVTNAGSDSLSAIDTTQSPPAVTASVNVGSSPSHMAVSPDGTRLYLTNINSNILLVIDTTQSPPAVTASVILSSNASDVAVGLVP